MDHILKFIEEYAKSLELKTQELDEERRRADQLLYRMLPR